LTIKRQFQFVAGLKIAIAKPCQSRAQKPSNSTNILPFPFATCSFHLILGEFPPRQPSISQVSLFNYYLSRSPADKMPASCNSAQLHFPKINTCHSGGRMESAAHLQVRSTNYFQQATSLLNLIKMQTYL